MKGTAKRGVEGCQEGVGQLAATLAVSEWSDLGRDGLTCSYLLCRRRWCCCMCSA